MEKIILVRHTEAEGGDGNIFRGQTDLDLLPEGFKHAKKVGEKLKKLKIDKIYSSKLSRAIHTAEAIAGPHKLDITKSPKINEMSFGMFDGLLVKDVKKKYHDILGARNKNRLNFRIPGGGESYVDVSKRALPFILKEAKKNPGKTLMFVAHASLIKAILVSISKNKGLDDFSGMIHYGCRVFLKHDNGKLNFQHVEND